QQQGCDGLAEALLLTTQGARLDGHARFDAADLAQLAALLAKASSAFNRDEIVARALDRRCRALGLRAGTSELLLLMDGEKAPLETLLLPDDDFRDAVATLEAELGEV